MAKIEGGSRITGGTVKDYKSGMPLVSVITVVYNNKKLLQKTIESVVAQEYPNVEYIVVDGGSTDGTIELLQFYGDKINYWLSEKDAGIYDAMNKGLQFATGDYVWFINAGDQIPDPEILRKVMSSNKSIDIIYGDTMIIDEEDNKLGLRRLRPPAKLNWKSFGMGMVVCHQAILVKRKLAEEYDLTYSIAADYDWVLRALKKSKNIVNTNIILIMYLAGGFSRHNVFPSLLERFTIMVKNYGLFRTIVYHFKITLRLFGYLYKRIIK